MNAYNPISTMQRLEAAGIKRQHAEALADAITDGRNDLVTRSDLKAELNAQALRICSILGAAMAIGFAALGVLISLSH